MTTLDVKKDESSVPDSATQIAKPEEKQDVGAAVDTADGNNNTIDNDNGNINGNTAAPQDKHSYKSHVRNCEAHPAFVRWGVLFFLLGTFVLLVLADFGSGVTADSVMMQAGEIVQTVTILNVSAWYCQLGSSGKPNPIRWQSLLPSPELEWQHPQVVAVTIVVVLVVILKRAFFLFFAKNCTQNTVL